MEQVLVNGLYQSMSYALIALGLTLIFAIMNVLNFAHGQMYVLGGFVTYYVYGVFKLPFALALAASILTLAVIGLLFDKVLFRRVIRMSARDESTMLLAAGTALMLESLALAWFGEKQRGVPAVVGGVYEVAGAFIPKGRLLVFAIALIAVAAFLLLMQYTRPGRALRALAQDKEAAALQGVNIDHYSAVGFAIGAALAGLSGALLVTVNGVNSGLGTSISIDAFIMVMIGGAGVVSGAILGAFALGFAKAVGYALIPGSITPLLIFAAMILFLIFRPQGIMGKPWG